MKNMISSADIRLFRWIGNTMVKLSIFNPVITLRVFHSASPHEFLCMSSTDCRKTTNDVYSAAMIIVVKMASKKSQNRGILIIEPYTHVWPALCPFLAA